MSLTLYTHPSCLQHDTGPGHVERIDRLKAVLAALRTPEFSSLPWREDFPPATREQIERVHAPALYDAVQKAIPKNNGYTFLDPDTAVSSGSWDAALHAAGAVIAAVDDVMSGKTKHAFCAVRPPGHHAEPDTSMGFCLFNNIAIGAAHFLFRSSQSSDGDNSSARQAARPDRSSSRIAIIDFDVHHGNGTQAWAENEPRAFYVSTHQYPLYPGTGAAHERGKHNNILNVPLHAGTAGDDFLEANESAFPVLRAFKPDLIMISAGFDAHELDPLAMLQVPTSYYGYVTEKIAALADELCNGKIVSALEGGYDLNALAAATAEHVRTLQ
jgi:acetoin utilization deacetylase AcuC-like enzyme